MSKGLYFLPAAFAALAGCLLISGGGGSWLDIRLPMMNLGSIKTSYTCWAITAQGAGVTSSTNVTDAQVNAGGGLLLAGGVLALLVSGVLLYDVATRGAKPALTVSSLVGLGVALVLGIAGTGTAGAKFTEIMDNFNALAAFIPSVTVSAGPARGAAIAGVIWCAIAIVGKVKLPASNMGGLPGTGAVLTSVAVDGGKQNPAQGV